MTSSTKRKIDDYFAANCKKRNGGGAQKAASIALSWADLPDELVRGIGQHHKEPRDLAVMERTCRSWRKVVIVGNCVMELPGCDESTPKVCLWRDLALATFPALPSIVTALPSKGCVISLSWKLLYRSQLETSKGRVREDYKPTTTLDDYIFTYEFRRQYNNRSLFITSGLGKRTPPIWKQETKRAVDSYLPVCDVVDPSLAKCLGEDPLSANTLSRICARVVVTRISDMKAVELVTSSCLGEHERDWDPICNGKLVFSMNCDDEGYWRREFLPTIPEHTDRWMMLFRLDVSNGQVHLGMKREIMQNVACMLKTEIQLDFPDDAGILWYLEKVCPWANV